MKILMTLKGTVIASATLDDNESARHFAALLPLDLVLKDYAATEKIADLPGALPDVWRAIGIHAVRRRPQLLRTLGQPCDLPQGVRVFKRPDPPGAFGDWAGSHAAQKGPLTVVLTRELP